MTRDIGGRDTHLIYIKEETEGQHTRANREQTLLAKEPDKAGDVLLAKICLTGEGDGTNGWSRLGGTV